MENRTIKYTDETALWSNMARAGTWMVPGANTRLVPTGKGKRIVLLHIGGEQGFFPEMKALFYDDGKNSDYYSTVTGELFERWGEKLLEYLEEKNMKNTVIIMDSAQCHSRIADGIPKSNQRKEVYLQYLRSINIKVDVTMPRNILWEMVKTYRPKFPYTFDQKAAEKGHQVLRTPPYHPELQPIELIWKQLKDYVFQNRAPGNFTFTHLKDLVERAIQNITPENWKKCVQHVKKIEEQYFNQENLKKLEPFTLSH
eukprot:GCRY01005902.1.p1 GENE.GCRY01005902.1~~GCRY01005902.1.p1  ORF type:complete len:256 (+),score=30.95 GCRY01005902.1:381-1148(+)